MKIHSHYLNTPDLDAKFYLVTPDMGANFWHLVPLMPLKLMGAYNLCKDIIASLPNLYEDEP